MRGLFRSTLILFLQPAWGDPMVPMPSQVHSGPVQPEGVSDTLLRRYRTPLTVPVMVAVLLSPTVPIDSEATPSEPS